MRAVIGRARRIELRSLELVVRRSRSLWPAHGCERSLFVQARGALRKELTRCLRSKHTTRRPRGHTVMNGQGQLRATLNIRERPAEADDRAVPGHWEGDLLMGKRMHAM